jgi:Fe2+ transport system protein FeoA
MHETCAGLCPLHQVRAGLSVRIKRLPDLPEVTCRLREIGFCEGQIIKLVINSTSLICQICNERLAISARLAQAILVEPIESISVTAHRR